jgi:hypothetical protein
VEAIVSRWVVLVQVAVAFWFVAGLAGRNLVPLRARSSGQLALVGELAALAGALCDPVVAAARLLEPVVVAAILTLMVVKPF